MIKTTQMSQTEPELSFFLPAAILMVWLAALLSVFLPGVIVPILLVVPIVVALSCGADSVALLSALVSEGYNCVAAHCNFHLRGEESLRDMRFAEEITEKLGVASAQIGAIKIYYIGCRVIVEFFGPFRQQVGGSYCNSLRFRLVFSARCGYANMSHGA